MEQLPGDKRALTTRRAVRLRAVRQGFNLSVGVGGIVGGAALLVTNLLGAGAMSAGALHWVPLAANIALILGGLMFLRQFRRSSRTRNQADVADGDD